MSYINSNKKRTSLVLIALFTMSLSACGAGSSSGSGSSGCTPADLGTITKGTITVGVSDMPPQSSTQDKSGMKGIDADIIRGFAKEECLNIKVVKGQPDSQVAGVQQGRWDTSLGGWFRSESRSKIVNMGYPMYLDKFAVIAKDKVTNLDELKGKTVGSMSGNAYVNDLKKLYGSKLKLYSSALQASQDLSAGRLDVVIDAQITASSTYDLKRFKTSIPEPTPAVPASEKSPQCGLPFKKGKDKLLKAFDAYIQKAHQDGSIKKILTKWNVPDQLGNVGDPYLI